MQTIVEIAVSLPVIPSLTAYFR